MPPNVSAAFNAETGRVRKIGIPSIWSESEAAKNDSVVGELCFLNNRKRRHNSRSRGFSVSDHLVELCFGRHLLGW